MTEPTRCFVCVNYTQGTGKLRLGLGNCLMWPTWTYPNPYTSRADCPAFKEVEPADLPARLKWEGKQ